MKSTKGFTLIELLVVIAIIGILSSVVLASLNSARTKGADAAIKSNLANARSQAELYYDSNNSSYALVCSNPGGIATQIAGAASAGGFTTGASSTASAVGCDSRASSWIISSPLKGGGYYCVDSTGKATTTVAAIPGGVACP